MASVSQDMQIIINAQNNASPDLKAVSGDVRNLGSDIKNTQAGATPQVKAMSDSFIDQRENISNLASGVTYLGTTFLALGIAMQSSNNEMIKSLGNTVTLVGGIAAFVGQASMFIYAIGNMTKALKGFNIQQVIAKALSGPWGWVALGVGAAAAAGGIAYVATRGGGGGGNVTVHNNIAGSVITERELGEISRREIIKTDSRTGSSGIK